jgi:hypothetical protein
MEEIIMEDRATIVVKRSNWIVGSLGKIGIYIDDEKVGMVRSGETARYIVDPGQHTIFIKPSFDWSRSHKLSFDVKPGQIKQFECGHKNAIIPVSIPFIYPITRLFYPRGEEPLFISYLPWVIFAFMVIISFMPSSINYLKESN